MRTFMFAAAATLAVASYVQVTTTAQTPASSSYKGPRTPDGKPDLNGIWQALSEAHFNLEPHSAQMEIQAGMGVVEGGTIPYKPEAAKNTRKISTIVQRQPLNKCYLPSVPRVTYLPFPFEIHYSPTHVIMASAFHHATRTVYTDGTPHAQALDLSMGDSRGRWEGDTWSSIRTISTIKPGSTRPDTSTVTSCTSSNRSP